ncbi:MAG: hypothetical protein AABW51_01635 [Nanoarchaeota archaeon]|mgnify:CR=1 FL=1
MKDFPSYPQKLAVDISEKDIGKKVVLRGPQKFVVGYVSRVQGDKIRISNNPPRKKSLTDVLTSFISEWGGQKEKKQERDYSLNEFLHYSLLR